MPFIPHTEEDTREMLATIGVKSIDELFDEIPSDLLVESLEGVPDALNEMQIGRLMRDRAARDAGNLCFIGAGAYEHHIPSAVWELTTRGEFYSAYTPYQAEASQGTLQTIYEYQTMITELTGLDVSNASLYDGASALAEAALMAVRSNRKIKSRRVLLAPGVNPTYEKVAAAIAGTQDITFERLPMDPVTGNAPAELPEEIGAFKSQQHRWTKGSIQTCKKLHRACWGSGSRPRISTARGRSPTRRPPQPAPERSRRGHRLPLRAHGQPALLVRRRRVRHAPAGIGTQGLRLLGPGIRPRGQRGGPRSRRAPHPVPDAGQERRAARDDGAGGDRAVKRGSGPVSLRRGHPGRRRCRETGPSPVPLSLLAARSELED